MLEDAILSNGFAMGVLRDICIPAQVYCNDQYYAVLKVDELEIDALCLYVTWYKRRGATDQVYLLSDDQPPRVPTEKELFTILRYFADSQPKEQSND